MDSLACASCFSSGYLLIQNKRKEEEIKQGGTNPVLSSLNQIVQVFSFSNISGKVLNILSPSKCVFTAKCLNNILPYTSIVACPTSAMIGSNNYKELETVLKTITADKFPLIAHQIPDKVSNQTVSRCQYFTNNLGKITLGGMYAIGIALPFIGQTALGLSVLAPLLYNEVEERNYIPFKVSAFMEEYMPNLSHIFNFFGGGSKVFSGLSLVSNINPIVNQAYYKLDKKFIRLFQAKIPTLEEIDNPLLQMKELSLFDIKGILDAPLHSFTINPSHCSKEAFAGFKIDRKHDFDHFSQSFASIDWSILGHTVIAKLKKDSRFKDFLVKKFPGSDIEKNFIHFLSKIAERNRLSVEEYAVSYFKKEFQDYIEVLKGNKKPKGSIIDTLSAIENTTLILSHLYHLEEDKEHNLLSIQDLLLGLGIDCGNYCARGLRRTTQEMIENIIFQKLPHLKPEEVYELRTYQGLQNLRMEIMTQMYLKFVEAQVYLKKGKEIPLFSSEITDPDVFSTAGEVHFSDLYKHFFALGFCPLTYFERKQVGINDIIIRSNPGYPFASLLNASYQTYLLRIEEPIANLGEAEFTNYITRWILTNPKLMDQKQLDLLEQQNHLLNKLVDTKVEIEKQKIVEDLKSIEEQLRQKSSLQEELLDIYTEKNDDKWTIEETKTRFHYLYYTMLGVLNVSLDSVLPRVNQKNDFVIKENHIEAEPKNDFPKTQLFEQSFAIVDDYKQK
ncbi:MAG: hypothetical protein BGO10_09715 [Chlamydia sp. 32-24]|nr:MAG: hypothetical protein BGO10_09715 [Chlamydia sp. 32-24]